MPIISSPLRYPGGKTQLYAFIKQTISYNNLPNSITYCEPCAGGAGIAISLLLKGDVKQIIINDYDIAIYSVWHAILHETKRLISKIRRTSITIDEWHKQREIYAKLSHFKKYSFKLAFATFFLNRTTRSGIITGGPIGGHKQESKYTIDCRFNKEVLIAKIKTISEHKDYIQLYNLDIIDFINQVILTNTPDKLFIYLDPPYYIQGQSLYKVFFNEEHHELLARTLRKLDHYNWIATYDNSLAIKELYIDDRPIKEYSLRYSANKVREEKEILFCSKAITVKSFDKVSLKNSSL